MGLTTGGVRFSGGFSGHRAKETEAHRNWMLPPNHPWTFFSPMALWLETQKKDKNQASLETSQYKAHIDQIVLHLLWVPATW